MAGLKSTATPDALASLLDRVRAGTDVRITPSDDGVLDAASDALAPECRVVRVRPGPAPLSLSGLMAQIAGNADLSAQDDSVVELGFRRLAVPDAPGQRIALMVSGAGQLQRSALRFIQHIARNAPALVLVLAGGPELDALLEEPEFTALRARLQRPADVEAPAAVREPVSALSHRPRRSPVWAAAGLGLAASVGLASWGLQTSARAPEPPIRVAVQRAEAAEPPAQKQDSATQPSRQEVAAPAPAQAAAPAPVQEAMLLPAAPAPIAAPPPTAEPERVPVPPRPPKQAEARPKDATARAALRRVRAARAGGARGAEPYWADELPPPAYDDPAPRYWARPSDEPWGRPPPPPPEGSYIGSFAADRDGIRTFRYEGGWR